MSNGFLLLLAVLFFIGMGIMGRLDYENAVAMADDGADREVMIQRAALTERAR